LNKIEKKLVKLQTKAQDCVSRKQAVKIINKAKKLKPPMIKIYDNFLSREDFKLTSSFLLSSQIPWTYSDTITGREQGSDSYQFVHTFFNFATPFDCNSCKYSRFLDPLWNKLAPKYILRVKANLRPRTSELVQSDWHTDVDFEQAKTCIFYLNSNNGCTVFKSGERVNSQANRLLLFDSHLEHSGTSCTDQLRRVVLNINYVPSKINGLYQLPSNFNKNV
jgi:hypothetical protein